MSHKIILLAAALAGSYAYAAPSSAEAEDKQGVFEAQGTVITGAYEPNAQSWFSLWNPEIGYVFDPSPISEELWALVSRASNNNRSIKVRYDATAGRLNEPEGRVDYLVCAVTLDDAHLEITTGCGSRENERAEAQISAEDALVLGLAELQSGDVRVAHGQLDGALAAPPSSPILHRIALRARAESANAIAYEEEPWSERADRASLAALSDYRALARLKPDDVEVQFGIAAALEDLGDYSGAEAVYNSILERWPDESYRVAVRLGAIYRRQGDNNRALEQLDRLAAHDGPLEGMKFHYHRGWTLTRLGRFDEAIAQFTTGLRFQPDYSWAYIRRACANASLGQLSDALQDMEMGRALLADLPNAETAVIAHDLRRIEAVNGDLRSLIAGGEKKSFPRVCNGFWGRADEARPRSALLNHAG